MVGGDQVGNQVFVRTPRRARAKRSGRSQFMAEPRAGVALHAAAARPAQRRIDAGRIASSLVHGARPTGTDAIADRRLENGVRLANVVPARGLGDHIALDKAEGLAKGARLRLDIREVPAQLNEGTDLAGLVALHRLRGRCLDRSQRLDTRGCSDIEADILGRSRRRPPRA